MGQTGDSSVYMHPFKFWRHDVIGFGFVKVFFAKKCSFSTAVFYCAKSRKDRRLAARSYPACMVIGAPEI